MKRSLSIFFVFLLLSSPGLSGKNVVILKNPEKPKSEKTALLILNGLGTSNKGIRHQKRFFVERESDLYIPDYICKKSFEITKAKLVEFIERNSLADYKELYIFTYIIGAWSINEYINEVGQMNIKGIVYDRSPIQERAPQVVDDKVPFLGRIVAGRLLKDFKNMPYPGIQKNNIQIGIIIESKATSLMRKFEKYTLSLGPFDWKNPPVNQDRDDLIYTHLNHDEMYVNFGIIGNEIIHFLDHGEFSNAGRRNPFSWDPFVPYRKEKKKSG